MLILMSFLGFCWGLSSVINFKRKLELSKLEEFYSQNVQLYNNSEDRSRDISKMISDIDRINSLNMPDYTVRFLEDGNKTLTQEIKHISIEHEKLKRLYDAKKAVEDEKKRKKEKEESEKRRRRSSYSSGYSSSSSSSSFGSSSGGWGGGGGGFSGGGASGGW